MRQPDAVSNLFRTAERTDRHYGSGGQLRQAGGTHYQYDEEGNLVRKTLPDGQQWHYGWDGAGQLVEVRRPDGYAVTFAYDALGRRIRKRFRGKVTRWVWDGNVPLHEWSELELGPEARGVAALTTWLFEDESFVPLAKLVAQEAQSIVCDYLGTPLSMYDSQGKITWEMELDSYGAVRQGRGQAQDCPFRYQGQYEDTETGLYYNRFRYYDPGTGQYISQDPIRLLGGNGLYSYVNDVTNAVDPLGLAKWKPCRLTGKQLEDEIESELLKAGIPIVNKNHPVKVGNTVVGEIDLEVPQAIIEATVAPSGKLSQISKYMNNSNLFNPANKQVILFTPNYHTAAAIKEIESTGALVVKNYADLIGLVK